MNEIPNPITRVEIYLANLAGQSAVIPPAPITRIEQYLAKLVELNGGGTKEETDDNDGAVTKALDAGTLYHFTGDLTDLTITLTDTTDLAHYHFDFVSGDTAVELTLPDSVIMPDGFAVEANKRYEIDICNNYGTAQEWSVT